MKRGLTLVEVLASIVIMTMLTVHCIPLLRDAAISTKIERAIDLVELSRFADAVIADPASHGIDSLADVDNLDLPWAEQPDRPPVHVDALSATATDDEHPIDHNWLVFSCDDCVVVRCVPREVEQESAR